MLMATLKRDEFSFLLLVKNLFPVDNNIDDDDDDDGDEEKGEQQKMVFNSYLCCLFTFIMHRCT